ISIPNPFRNQSFNALTSSASSRMHESEACRASLIFRNDEEDPSQQACTKSTNAQRSESYFAQTLPLAGDCVDNNSAEYAEFAGTDGSSARRLRDCDCRAMIAREEFRFGRQDACCFPAENGKQADWMQKNGTILL